jgi:hypothetical protein
MNILTIFLGIIIFIVLYTVLLYLYIKLLGRAIIYDLKKTNPDIPVSDPDSPNYSFSVWIYVNSFVNESYPSSGTYNANVAESGKPIFYYGVTMKDNGYTAIANKNSASQKLVYLQLGANSPKLQYYYTTNTSSGYKFINITESIPIQKWTHVVISKAGGILEFYLDGKLIKTISETEPLVENSTSVIKLGKRSEYKYHDTFVSKIQRISRGVDSKTVYNLFMKGPGAGLNYGNTSNNNFFLQFLQNNKDIKTYSTD